MKHGTLIIIIILSLFPLGLMIINSFKDPSQYLVNPIGLMFPLHFENYISSFTYIGPYFFWTFLVIFVGISMNLLTSSIAAYAFSRYRFRGSGIIYIMIIGLMFIPAVLVLFPLYLWNVRLGLKDVYGLMVSYWILGHCFSIFLLTNFFRSIPEELLEAARIDGAGHLTIWWKIVVPLSIPILTTLAIMMLLWIYTNDYVWQYIMSSNTSRKMIPVVVRGLSQSGSGGADLNKGREMAGYVIASVPMLVAFLLASKTFIRGMTSGSIKG